MAFNDNGWRNRTALPLGWHYQFGIDPRQIPRTSRLGGGPIPSYYAQKDPSYTGGFGDSLGLDQNGTGTGTTKPKLPPWAMSAIGNGPGGFDSQYESQLAALLGNKHHKQVLIPLLSD
jgi:hypothetical protein